MRVVDRSIHDGLSDVKSFEALAHIRQLSCLGLPSEVVIPRMLEAIHDLVASEINTFVWTDAGGAAVNMFAPHVLQSTVAFMAEAYHLCQQPGELSIESLVNGPLVCGNIVPWYARGAYESTVAANEVFKPQGAACVLDLVIRDEGGPRGMVLVHRGSSSGYYKAAELRVLAGLAPWFLQALDGARPFDGRYADTEDEEVLLCGVDGEILEASAGARRLLLYAGARSFVPGMKGGMDLPQQVRWVCRAFERARTGESSAPPRAQVETPWGRFKFQVHGLQPGVLAVVIRREEPLPLKLMGRLKTLPLSPREREVALHLGLGHGPEVVETRLGVTRATYRDYVERIHARLEVHSRAELVSMLTA